MAEKLVYPQSPEAEEALIGSILIEDRDGMKRVAHMVNFEDFYDKRRRVIFRTMEVLYRDGRAIDLLTVSDYLDMKGELEIVGGSAYISEMTNHVHSTMHMIDYAKIIADRSVLRRILSAASDIAKMSQKSDGDLDKLLTDAEARLRGVTRNSKRAEDRLATVDMEKWREVARGQQPPAGQIRGLSSGYKGLDDMTDGFEPGELYVVTGHTKHGKSQLATNWGVNVVQRGHNVLFINTEMTKKQVADRFNDILGDVPFKGKMRSNDRADVTYRDVITIIEQAKTEGFDMIIVDHLHYFSQGEENEAAAIGNIMKEFKEAAVQFELPILMLCHVSQGDTKKRPRLKDIKGSSSIAQYADLVMAVWRNDDPNSGENHVVEVLRLAARSARTSVKRFTMYTQGLKLTEEEPLSDTVRSDEGKKAYELSARMLGEKDDDLGDIKDAKNIQRHW